MKYLGLIADTHLEQCSLAKIKTIEKHLGNVDAILHAGDITHVSVLDCLETIAPVQAVKGNMDISPAISHLPSKIVLKMSGYRIGLIHGWGAPHGIRNRIQKSFADDNVSIIIYGHTHQADVFDNGRLLMINPGSAFDRRYAPFCSIGRLRLETDKASAEIIRL